MEAPLKVLHLLPVIHKAGPVIAGFCGFYQGAWMASSLYDLFYSDKTHSELAGESNKETVKAELNESAIT